MSFLRLQPLAPLLRTKDVTDGSLPALPGPPSHKLFFLCPVTLRSRGRGTLSLPFPEKGATSQQAAVAGMTREEGFFWSHFFAPHHFIFTYLRVLAQQKIASS